MKTNPASKGLLQLVLSVVIGFSCVPSSLAAAPDMAGLYYIPYYGGQAVPVTGSTVPRSNYSVYLVTNNFPDPSSGRVSSRCVYNRGEEWNFRFVDGAGNLLASLFYSTSFFDEEYETDCVSQAQAAHLCMYVHGYHFNAGNYSGDGCISVAELPTKFWFGFQLHCLNAASYTYSLAGSGVPFQLVEDVKAKLQSLGQNPQRPSVFTSRTIQPSSQGYEISVINECDSNAPLPNTNVTLDYSAVASSGGHTHHQARDDHAGLFELNATTHNTEPRSNSPFRVNTGAAGSVTVNYVAPQVSGQTKVTLSCTLSSGDKCEPRDEYINVGVTGLLKLGAGLNYDLVGTTANHPENHFGTARLLQGLRDLADRYALQYPGSMLKYNDMSLSQGGLFDCFPCKGPGGVSGTPWNTPHAEHRKGMNADVSFRSFEGLTSKERATRMNATKKLIRDSEFIRIGLEHASHWHLTTQ